MAPFSHLTAFSYWLLLVLWGAILAICVRYLRHAKVLGPTIILLLSVLAIDAFRTFFESAYFGLYFNAKFGLIPASVQTFLADPRLVILPKLVNILAAVLILALLLSRWLPREIRTRREAASAALMGESRFQFIFDHARVGIALVDHNGHFVQVNGAWRTMMGYEPGELSRLTNLDITHPDDIAASRDRLKALFSGGASSYRLEKRLRRKDGSYLWVDLTVSPIVDAQGRVQAAVGTIQDIDAYKRAVTELHVSRRMLEMVLDAIPVRVFWKDRDSVYLGCNLHFARDAGLNSSAEIIGKNDYQLAWSEWADRYRADDSAVMRSGLPKLDYEEHITRPDGTRVSVRTSKIPMCDEDGSIIGVLACYEDITERKAVEARLRQAKKMEAVGQLTGGIAHDFNNILAIVMGNLDLLDGRMTKRYPDETGLRDLARRALGAAQRGADLTQRLLAFSRNQTLQPRPTDLNALVTGMTEILGRTLGPTVAVKTILADGLPPALADPHQVENALLNLALNARDAMPGGGTLTVETAPGEMAPGEMAPGEMAPGEMAPGEMAPGEMAPARHGAGPGAGEYVVMSVTDTGVGMPPEDVERAFEPFFTTKEAGSGSGLGLSMVYGFVTQSGGHVEIHSEPAHGTTVRIHLPRAAEGAAGDDRTLAEEPVPRGQGEAVLVVEDDPELRDLALRLLTELGYRARAVKSGHQALVVLERDEAVDLLFTGIALGGGLDGIDLAQEARRRRPGLKVLFAAGCLDGVAGGRVPAGEVSERLEKPYRRAILARKLRAVLARDAA